MLFNLCLKNIKKSIKDYSIYFVTLVIAVSIFYIFNSIEAQESMLTLTKQKYEIIQALIISINYVSVFVSFILGFLIIYSNNFLIKRRKKEMGLYLTLGMNKRKVSTILVIETLIVGFISLVVGLLIGIGLSQFLSVFTARLFEADMSKFEFIFSINALTKTIIYFGIIFIFVMIFNIITLSRYKLIDLINAKKKNEKIKIKNKYLTFLTFALSMVFLGYAYSLLFDDALIMLDNTTLKMLITGAIGTFLFFLSLSGFLLRIIEMNKKVYFNGLNMFILKQINNRVNTTVISTTIISLMLLLTIGILSGSMSLASVFNTRLKSNNLTDFTLFKFNNNNSEESTFIYDVNEIINTKEFKDTVSSYLVYNNYEYDDITIGSLLTEDSIKQLKKEFGDTVSLDLTVPIMSESDYNKIMDFYGRTDLITDIKDDEYLVLANIDKIINYYRPAIQSNNTIELNNKVLKPAKNKIIEIALQNSAAEGNDGVIVVSDNLLDQKNLGLTYVLGNYVKSNDIETLDIEFNEFVYQNSDFNITSKLYMEASSIGVKSIVTFLGLYLGIIFAISSATVLAIGQLSESSDNKERYRVLRQIGADDKMIKKSLFIQIAICFILPLLVALIHSYFGLSELNSLIKILGDIDLASNIIVTTIFIVIVYGGYFLATYLCSKNIIEEKK